MRTLLITAALLASIPALGQAQPAGQGAAAAQGVDAFARAAAENSLSEMLMSSLALQKSNDDRVRDYAWTMIDHHARATGDLAEALPEAAAVLPTEPSSEQQATIRRMQGMTGAQFDQAYLSGQVESHRRAVALFEGGSRLADPKVSDYARSTLPVLRAHLEIAQQKQAEPPRPMPQG